MAAEITRVDLRLRRRLLIGYSIGMAIYTLVIVALYPQFKNDTSLDKLTQGGSTVAALFGAVGSLTSPTGWLGANIYNNFLPLIALMATIGYGASCIAGQDEDGLLCIQTVLPVSRRSLLAQKLGALALHAAAISGVTMVCVLVGRWFELPVSIGNLAGTSIGVALLGIDFGLLALAVGCWSGSRGTALGVASGVAAAAYLVSSLAPVVHWVRPARYGSLFYWAVGDQQLDRGLGLGPLAVLVVVGVVLGVVALDGFRRLDLH